MVQHGDAGAAVGRQAGRIERHRGLRHAGGGFGRDLAARKHPIVIGVARDRDCRRNRGADVFDDTGAVAVGRVSILIGLRRRHGRRVAIARIGEAYRHVAVAIGTGHAIGRAAHRTVRADRQGGCYAVIVHSHRGAAVGRQAGRIQGHVGHGHAGCSLGTDFAAREHAVMIGVAGDRHHGRRGADMFDRARGIAVGAVAVLIGLRGRHGHGIAVAGVGERNRHIAVAVDARHAVGRTGNGAVGRHRQGCAHTIVDHGHGGAAIGRQAGCVQRHVGKGHAGRRLGIDFTAREHAVVVGVASDCHCRRRHADVLGRACGIAVGGVAEPVGLGSGYRHRIAVAGVGKGHRHVAVGVSRRDTVGRAAHRAV